MKLRLLNECFTFGQCEEVSNTATSIYILRKIFLALKTRAQAKDNHCYWSKIIAEKLLEGILHKDILKNARNLKLSTLTGAEGGSSCRDGRTMCPRSRFSTLINRTIPTNIEFIVYEVTVQR